MPTLQAARRTRITQRVYFLPRIGHRISRCVRNDICIYMHPASIQAILFIDCYASR